MRPDDLEGFVKLTEHAPLPITSCEVFTRRQQFDEWIERRAVDYIQPDVTKCGGLSEEYKIAMHAYERAVLFVPHGWNTAVGLAADLQLVSAVPVAKWVEYITPAPYGPLDYRTAARTLFLRPYFAHFCSFFRRFFAVLSVLTPGFQRGAPKDPGPAA